MTEVKLYVVRGKMLLSHDKNPEWRKFALEMRGTKKEEVIEKVYSELGSRHKLKRKHIVIEDIEEKPVTEAISKSLKDLEQISGWGM